MALVVVDAFDEAASGLPSASAFELRRCLDVEVAVLVGAVFTVPQLFALFVEAPFLVWAERWPRPRLLVAGLLGMAAALLCCALSPGLWGVALGCSVYFLASGVACGIAQAALMDADPERREQRMTEWAMSGWIGDLLSAPLLAASIGVGFGWRGAFLAVAAALCVAAFAASKVVLPPVEANEEEEEGATLGVRQVGRSLLLLVRERRLMWWLLGVTLCSLLDEIFAVLAGIAVAETSGAVAVATTLTTFTAGGVVGLLATKPSLGRWSSESLFIVSCVGCALGYGAWLVFGTGLAGLSMLFVAGACVALQYPIAQAAAYRALPGRSTLVAAAGSLFGGVELALPLLLGWLVDRAGVWVALPMLLLQPVGLLLIALLVRLPRSTGAAAEIRPDAD